MKPRGRLVAALVAIALVGCGPEESPPGARPAPAPPQPALELVFTYGSEKKSWITEVTKAFNESAPHTSSGKRISVQAIPMGSGECIDELLSGRRQAHLTSPASAAFIRLGNAESRARTGQDLIGATENLVLSPVVIAMWRPMAEALGWGRQPIGWADILGLARNPAGWAAYGHPEWGRFKFGHTHPEYSNSGLISALAIVYAASHKVTGLTVAEVGAPETARFMSEIESAVQHYGSSTGFFADKLVANGPGYLSAAVLYESSVIESFAATGLPFPLVAIYPKEGTFWSDHPVGVVQRPWVTPEHAEAAKLYVAWLLARPQQEKALTFGFRPGDPAIALAPPIDRTHGVDPKEPTTTLEVPTAEVMNAVITLWRQAKKKANVVLVLDTSGSMNEQQKLVNARAGATQLVAMLGDADTFSLVSFASETRWLSRGAPVREGREAATRTLQSLIAEGDTRLYDSIDEAYQYLATQPAGDKISAVVVLTDGADTKSVMPYATLLQRVRADSERRPIRIFTIGYGSGAKEDVLKQIADATQSKYYRGTPENIVEVFKDIATFF